MKFIKAFMLCLALLVSFQVVAKTENEVRKDLIEQMAKDSFFTESAKREAIDRYVTKAPAIAASAVVEGGGLTKQQKAVQSESWTDKYLTLSTFLKTAGVVVLLIVFWRVIAMAIGACLSIILSVPVAVYQTVGLAATGGMTLYAHAIWYDQAVWLAIFGAFGNILMLTWILAFNRPLAQKLSEIIHKLKFNEGVVAGAIGMVYFGALAVGYQSEILGFFSVVSFCAMLTFSMGMFPGVVWLDVSQRALSLSLFVHTAVLAALAYVNINSVVVPHLQLWAAGLNYYIPVALGLSVLVGASPWYRGNDRAFVMLMTALITVGAMFAYSVAGMGTASVIVFIFLVILALEWIGYVTFSAHYLVGLSVIGGLLFFSGTWIEKNSSWIWAVLSHGTK